MRSPKSITVACNEKGLCPAVDFNGLLMMLFIEIVRCEFAINVRSNKSKSLNDE